MTRSRFGARAVFSCSRDTESCSMRPDEHKKKKNTQYKKKHGISTTDKDSGKKPDKRQQKESVKTGPESHKDLVANHKTAATGGASGNADLDQPKETFRRRQIESNWSRYDDLPDETDDLPDHRGEDFGKLLAAAGSSVAQFRLRGEEDWEEGEEDVSGSEFLSVDLEEISAALACIPLNDRLAISSSFFSEQQLEEINSASQLHSETYKLTDELDTMHIAPGNPAFRNDSVTLNSPQHVHAVTPDKGRSLCHVSKDCSAEKTVSSDRQTVDKTGDTKVSCSKQNSVDSKTKLDSEDTKALEEDLDLLLGLDQVTPEPVPMKDTTPAATSLSGSADGNLNTQPSTAQEQTVVSSEASTVQPVTEKPSAKTEENLEDWLDSMLDD